MTSRTAPEFWQLYRELPPEIKAAARKAYASFLHDPRHASLRLERLRSDPRDYRAVALRSGDDWLWFWIGTHKEFDRKFPV